MQISWIDRYHKEVSNHFSIRENSSSLLPQEKYRMLSALGNLNQWLSYPRGPLLFPGSPDFQATASRIENFYRSLVGNVDAVMWEGIPLAKFIQNDVNSKINDLAKQVFNDYSTFYLKKFEDALNNFPKDNKDDLQALYKVLEIIYDNPNPSLPLSYRLNAKLGNPCQNLIDIFNDGSRFIISQLATLYKKHIKAIAKCELDKFKEPGYIDSQISKYQLQIIKSELRRLSQGNQSQYLSYLYAILNCALDEFPVSIRVRINSLDKQELRFRIGSDIFAIVLSDHFPGGSVNMVISTTEKYTTLMAMENLSQWMLNPTTPLNLPGYESLVPEIEKFYRSIVSQTTPIIFRDCSLSIALQININARIKNFASEIFKDHPTFYKDPFFKALKDFPKESHDDLDALIKILEAIAQNAKPFKPIEYKNNERLKAGCQNFLDVFNDEYVICCHPQILALYQDQMRNLAKTELEKLKAQAYRDELISKYQSHLNLAIIQGWLKSLPRTNDNEKSVIISYLDAISNDKSFEIPNEHVKLSFNGLIQQDKAELVKFTQAELVKFKYSQRSISREVKDEPSEVMLAKITELYPHEKSVRHLEILSMILDLRKRHVSFDSILNLQVRDLFLENFVQNFDEAGNITLDQAGEPIYGPIGELMEAAGLTFEQITFHNSEPEKACAIINNVEFVKELLTMSHEDLSFESIARLSLQSMEFIFSHQQKILEILRINKLKCFLALPYQILKKILSCQFEFQLFKDSLLNLGEEFESSYSQILSILETLEKNKLIDEFKKFSDADKELFLNSEDTFIEALIKAKFSIEDILKSIKNNEMEMDTIQIIDKRNFLKLINNSTDIYGFSYLQAFNELDKESQTAVSGSFNSQFILSLIEARYPLTEIVELYNSYNKLGVNEEIFKTCDVVQLREILDKLKTKTWIPDLIKKAPTLFSRLDYIHLKVVLEHSDIIELICEDVPLDFLVFSTPIQIRNAISNKSKIKERMLLFKNKFPGIDTLLKEDKFNLILENYEGFIKLLEKGLTKEIISNYSLNILSSLCKNAEVITSDRELIKDWDSILEKYCFNIVQVDGIFHELSFETQREIKMDDESVKLVCGKLNLSHEFIEQLSDDKKEVLILHYLKLLKLQKHQIDPLVLLQFSISELKNLLNNANEFHNLINNTGALSKKIKFLKMLDIAKDIKGNAYKTIFESMEQAEKDSIISHIDHAFTLMKMQVPFAEMEILFKKYSDPIFFGRLLFNVEVNLEFAKKSYELGVTPEKIFTTLSMWSRQSNVNIKILPPASVLNTLMKLAGPLFQTPDEKFSMMLTYHLEQDLSTIIKKIEIVNELIKTEFNTLDKILGLDLYGIGRILDEPSIISKLEPSKLNFIIFNLYPFSKIRNLDFLSLSLEELITIVEDFEQEHLQTLEDKMNDKKRKIHSS